ncbi:MAG: restriction endonuclease subunit S [Bacteroidales bacterium]|nr:restriction endonuclease subunit S [Bacteroidales bacterium]
MNTKNKKILSDICTISTGVYLREPEGNDVCYLQISDIANKDICAKSKKFAYRPGLNNYLVRANDLLMVSKGVAYACRVFDGQEPSIASTSFLVLRIAHPMILPDYLCWFLNHPNTVKSIRARQEGTGTLMIRKSDIESLEVPIPEIEDQKKIVAIDMLSRREVFLMKTIAERKQTLMDQILYKVL